MILVNSIYEDVRDVISKDENGYLDYETFNRMSRRAELRLLDWLTGDVTGNKLPISFSNQKTKDWLSPLLRRNKSMLDSDGAFTKPDNYYYYDNLYSLTLETVSCNVDEELSEEIKSNIVTLLDGDRFNHRKNTSIRKLRPTPTKAIAKEIGKQFFLYPTGIPGVVLEYISLPVFANIIAGIDATYNEPVVDEAASTNYVWDEGVREALVYFIADSFVNKIELANLKAMSNASNQSTAGK